MVKEIESPLLTRKQAAKYLNISIATLDRHPEIPRIKLFGNQVMFEKATLDREIEKYRLPGVVKPTIHEQAVEAAAW